MKERNQIKFAAKQLHPSILNPQSSILNPQSSILNPQSSILNPQSSILKQPFLFISDLHLSESKPKITEHFFSFLKQYAKKANSLYILGDFFEYWIGDDDLSAFNNSIIQALKSLTDSGVALYLMHGNRDFLIGKKFAKMTGAILLPDPSIIEIDHHSILLTHGDMLTNNEKYLAFRKKIRNRFNQSVLFLWRSLEKRRKIAQQYREHSTSFSEKKLTDEDRLIIHHEAAKTIQKSNVHYFIHGHTHDPGIICDTIDHATYTRITLGHWTEEKSSVLFCTLNHEGKLVFDLKNI